MRNLRNFGITFAVSLVILAVAAVFACGYVAETVSGIFNGPDKDLTELLTPVDTEQNPTNSDDRLNKEINGESFTWLWVVSDYRPSVFDNYFPMDKAGVNKLNDEFGMLGKGYRFPDATSIVVVRADVKTREYIIMTVPSATRVATASGNMALGRVYALGGIGALSEKVSAMTGLDIDYYSVIHSTDLPQIANMIGSISMALPVDIYTDGKNYVSAPQEEETTDADGTTKANGAGAKDTDKNDTDKKDGDSTAETEEEKAVLKKELDRSSSVRLAQKLTAALLYYDDSDGIDDEMAILQSFANGVMVNLQSYNNAEMTAMLKGLSGTFVSNNVDTNAITLSGEVIRAYSWFEIKFMTYPGKFVSRHGANDAYYNPDIEQCTAMFADYR